MTGDKRRTIMGGDAPPYRGPEQIQRYYDSANQKIKRTVRGITKNQPCPYPEESQRHFITLWLSGCREGEGIMLEPSGFTWGPDSIGYRKCPVLKKREKVRKNGEVIYRKVETQVRQQDGSVQPETIYRPESKQKIVYREHLMPRDIPLGEEFIEMIQTLQEQGYKYVLYRRQPFDRSPSIDQPCSTRTVVNRVTELHPDLFPHGMRALQVRYLKDKYGKKFDVPELKQHFRWSSTEMAVYYLSGQDLAEAMGVSVPW